MAQAHIRGNPVITQIGVKLTGAVPANDIVIGDLVAAVAGYAVPASQFTWTTDLPTTQAAFKLAFAGFSVGRSRAATLDPRDLYLPLATDGDVSVTVPTGTVYKFGDLLGPAKNGATSNLVSTMAVVATSSLAVMMVVERIPTSSTTTQVIARLIDTPV